MTITINSNKVDLNNIDRVEYRNSELLTGNRPALVIYLEGGGIHLCICESMEEYFAVTEMFKAAINDDADFDLDSAREKARRK